VKVGVVGVGYWGPNLLRNLIETNRCSELWCYDLCSSASAKVRHRFPCVRFATSLQELIGRCDAVMVATPVETHAPLARAILDAGRTVFVEKPLTNSSQKAEELLQLAERRRAVLMVGHTFIYSPAVRKIREYIDNRTLGDIYFISASRVNLGLHRKDVNVVWDLAAHDLSILYYWLGAIPLRVAALGRACVGRMVDVASLHCEFPEGVVANIEVSWLAPCKLRRTVLIGSERMVLYDDTQTDEKIKLLDRGVKLEEPQSFGEYQLTYRTGDVLSPFLDITEPVFLQTRHFLDCVETGARPETDGFVGLKVVTALEAACESIDKNGAFVETSPSTSACAPRRAERARHAIGANP